MPQTDSCRTHPQPAWCTQDHPTIEIGQIGATGNIPAYTNHNIMTAAPRSPATNNFGTTPPIVYNGPTPSQNQMENVPGWYDCSQVPTTTPVNNYLGTSACPYNSGSPPPNYDCFSIELPPPRAGGPCSYSNSCATRIATVCRQTQQPPSGGAGGSPPPEAPCPGNEQRDGSGFCERPRPAVQ